MNFADQYGPWSVVAGGLAVTVVACLALRGARTGRAMMRAACAGGVGAATVARVKETECETH